MKKKTKKGLNAAIQMMIPLLFLFFILVFFTAVSSLDENQNEEGRQQLEAVLRQASVACYAAEGVYPPDLEYLQDHYGIQINKERYTVFYEVFASNMMPEITVLEKES